MQRDSLEKSEVGSVGQALVWNRAEAAAPTLDWADVSMVPALFLTATCADAAEKSSSFLLDLARRASDAFLPSCCAQRPQECGLPARTSDSDPVVSLSPMPASM